MRHFGSALRGGLRVESKSDASPVTVADRSAEDWMRQQIHRRFPTHQVLGEEGGLSGPLSDSPRSAFRWVLDPIDGTRSFIHGVPLFGTLIALLHDGQPLLGVIQLPATGEQMLGVVGRQTVVNGKPVRVRETASLDEAVVLFTDVERLLKPNAIQERSSRPSSSERSSSTLLDALSQRAGLVRGWGDCYGHFMVAAGRAEVMFDPILSLWDVAALKPCVEGAGGRLTDGQGRNTGLGESALSTNGRLHAEVLQLVQEHRW